MEFVGLIKDHEPGLVKLGQSLLDIADLNKVHIEDIGGINSYLQNGTVVIAFLHSIFFISTGQEPVLLFPSGIAQIRVDLNLVKRV